jgi:thiol-disulfide isomerase/thioredoxin
MKKITILIVVAVLCPFFYTYAQSKSITKPLRVGDTIPDVVLDNVLNFKTKSIRLSDYKDKLVIIDLWATWCAPCIRHMPINYAIQLKHPDSLFFLLLNHKNSRDKEAEVQKFLDRRKAVFKLPSVVLDTVLTNLFQAHTMGTYYWIKNGVLVAVTGEEEITDEKVAKMLANDNVVHQKPTYSFDNQKPIFFGNNGGPQQQPYVFRSVLFPWSEDYHGIGSMVGDDGNINRIYAFNVSALQLIQLSNPDLAKFSTTHLKINVKDAEKLVGNNRSKALEAKTLYCYEALFPPVSKDRAWTYYREDIRKFFPYKLDTVKLKDSCWVLKLRTGSKLKKGSGKSETNIDERLGIPVFFNNYPLIVLVTAMADAFKIPVLDETGYSENVTLDLPPYLKDTDALAKSLYKQGLVLTKELRESEYLVITDSEETLVKQH